MQNLKKQAAQQGLDKNIKALELNAQQQALTNKGQDMQTQNAAQQAAISQHDKILKKDMQNRADQYEKDRIGQGKIASGVAKGLDTVTNGKFGETIGGPSQKDRDIFNGKPKNGGDK